LIGINGFNLREELLILQLTSIVESKFFVLKSIALFICELSNYILTIDHHQVNIIKEI